MKALFPTKTPIVAALLLALSACTPARFPLQISDLSVSPDPVVGKVVALDVQIRSSDDEENVLLQIRLPDGVRLIEGDLEWHGSLAADEPVKQSVFLCVVYPGDWRIYIGAYSLVDGNTKYADSDTIHFISTAESGRAVPGAEYTIIQDTPAPVPSPTPVTTPAIDTGISNVLS